MILFCPNNALSNPRKTKHSDLTWLTWRCRFIGLKPPNCGGGKFGDWLWLWPCLCEEPRLKTVWGGDCLCTGVEPGAVWEGLGRLSNLASLLKKVLGGRELPNTDWRVRGCSGDRKLLKLTNCWFVEGLPGLGLGLNDWNCDDWPGKLTGPPLGLELCWNWPPDWPPNWPPKKVNGWLAGGGGRDSDSLSGGILVCVCPSWVWTLKKVFWKFCWGLLGCGGGRKTDGDSSLFSSLRKTFTGGTGSLSGGDGINLSWSSFMLVGGGGGLVGVGGPLGVFGCGAGGSVGLVGSRLGPLSSSCSCWFSSTFTGKEGKFLKGLNGPNVVTSTLPSSSLEVDLSCSASNSTASSAFFLFSSFLSTFSFSILSRSSSLCLSISLCRSMLAFLSSSFCSSNCLSISFCFSSLCCLSISRSLFSSNSISFFCFSTNANLSSCFCFSICFCLWISCCLSACSLLGCSRGGGGSIGTGGSRLGSIGLKFWKWGNLESSKLTGGWGWGGLGTGLDGDCLEGGCLELFGGCLGPVGGCLGPVGGCLGPVEGCLGPVGGCLGPVWGCLEPVEGCLVSDGGCLEPVGGPLGGFVGNDGGCLALIGPGGRRVEPSCSSVSVRSGRRVNALVGKLLSSSWSSAGLVMCCCSSSCCFKWGSSNGVRCCGWLDISSSKPEAPTPLLTSISSSYS